MLAADALKAWVLDNPDEVRAETCCSCKQAQHTHAKASDGTPHAFLLTLGPIVVLAASWRAGTPADWLCLGATCLQALEPCVASLDLLLRWCVLRLADGNTQTLVSVTSLLKVRCAGPGSALHCCVVHVCCAARHPGMPLPTCVAAACVC